MAIQIIVSIIVSLCLCWIGGGVINGSFDLLSASEEFRVIFALMSAFIVISTVIIFLDV